MKFKSIYLIIPVCIIIFGSCKKDLFNANKNPTAVTADQYDPNFLLTTVQLMYTGSHEFQGENWLTEWGGVAGFIQHVSSTNVSYYYGDKYLYSPGNFGKYFQQAYIAQVQPAVELYQLTLNKPEASNLHQMARIMKALVFERITDIYGDVPYSQAGLGYYQHIFTPIYDKQQDIYTDLLKEVSEATDSLNENGDKPTGDVFYSRNPSTQIDEWKKFGNSLLLRMAMRLTKVDPATAQGWVKKVAGKTMQSNDDNAIVNHSIGEVTQNRDAWEILGQDSTDLKLSDVFIHELKSNDDPRLPVIAWIFATGDRDPADQIGLPQGYIIGGLNPTYDITKRADFPADGMQGYSRLSDRILNLTAPNFIVTYGETELLFADAAKRWGIGEPGDDSVHFKNGVEASITQFSAYGKDATISAKDADNYYKAHSYDQADGLNQINTQYWICTLMDEYETWSNWRRSGYPKLTPTRYPGNITNNTIPRRMEYPTDQPFSNAINYKAAIANLPGGDQLTSRIWWDK